MGTQVSVVIFLFTLFLVKSEIYLDNTDDGLIIEFYDCVRVQSLDYCRRPEDPINLIRDNDNSSCEDNGGKLRHFSELQSKNITASTLLQQWISTLERIEQYARYLTDSNESDGYLCQCLHAGSFGKSCEYRLPVGQTFEETVEWQFIMRAENSQSVQIYGDVVCYKTLECNSGVLCLDWREICDGIQHCQEGRDEENCDLLEMNQCNEDKEYRCENGMCIPQEFFLDGKRDCLDWSDEMQLDEDWNCPLEGVSSECDDHICLPNEWSCGDGQCIEDRLRFQRLFTEVTCRSGRDQYFICETHLANNQWTMENGRCFVGDRYKSLTMLNGSNDEECEYLLKCTLSRGLEMNCPCYDDSECARRLVLECPSPWIPYPRDAVVTPFTFFLFNRKRDRKNKRPDQILIYGTVRCRGVLINVTKIVPFDNTWNERQMIEEHFCQPFRSNISSSDTTLIDQKYFNANVSLDRCGEWKEYSSVTRINDGLKNCRNGKDEIQQTEMEIEKSCASVRRHRFHCSADQPTCLSVTRLGIGSEYCRNGFDEFLFGVGRTISSIGCNDERQDQCSLLRQYIWQSSTSTRKNEIQQRSGLPFRSHCDTFSDLSTGDDENLRECRHWWICPKNQQRCQSGQCVEQSWINDWEWDCPDAEDEHGQLNWTTRETLQRASRFNFRNRSFVVPSSCPQTHPYLCLASNATQQGFSCSNLSQIGDGNIDCAGGQDEKTIFEHCSSSSSILGLNFLCPSTNSCIPYYFHCWKDEYRCPNRSDDQFWCERQSRPENCSDLNDFVCFDGRCLKGGRCNAFFECPFFEDEYMCDYPSSLSKDLAAPRKPKRFSRGRRSAYIRLPRFPADVTNPEVSTGSSSTMPTILPPITSIRNTSIPSLSPYVCNRGLGVLGKNHRSVICFCPPQYYGEKCQYHADRVSVVLHLDLSQSIFAQQKSPTDLLKLLVLFLFNDDQVLMLDQFHLHPSIELDSLLDNNHKKTKLITHFLYPRSSTFLQQRRERFFNRSDILHRQPFSIRIELYQTRMNERPSFIALWKYPLSFSHLPVSRLSQVLHFSPSANDQLNPCFSRPCRHPNEECHPLMNKRSEFICLCKTNFTGENCSEEDQLCDKGYCAVGSLCQPNSRSLLQHDSSPFCLCPSNRLGRRCSIEYDGCLSSPCQNGGSCFPDVRPDRVICLCQKEYFGSRCRTKRSSIQLSLSTDLLHRGVALQVLQIDLSSLELILLQQQVFLNIPQQMEYYHHDQSSLTGIILAKIYSSNQVHFSNLHLLSVHQDVSSLHGRTAKISSSNQCEHRGTFSNETSSIRYHYICITDATRLCFRDDVYLCICTDNHTRVECFNYDDQLDRCENCRAEGRCLQGNPDRPDDFVCLCPECYSGRQCQLSRKSFSFTLDQLFSPDLLSDDRGKKVFLLIFFPLVGFFLAILSNLFSFVTLRRRSCLRHGVGNYLLVMSITNQLSLALLVARLIHLSVIIAISRSSSPWIDHLFCKLLGYLLTCLNRLNPWLSSFVALERVYSVLLFNRHWFKQPHIARSLMLWAVVLILASAVYELVFVKSFPSVENGNSTMCVIEYPSNHQLMWISIHQFVSVIHFLLPLLINLFSTLTIIWIVIKNKTNIRATKHSNNEVRLDRRTVFRNVFNANREMITRPAITLVPSIFSLFSLPFLIISFSLGCQNLDANPLRYVLIFFYFTTFLPQMLMFVLYIYPSSFYWKEWQSVIISRRISPLRPR